MGGVELEMLATLFAVAVTAGCIDAIAGGGGLLTVPALLLAGLDPVSALATNKVQGAAGSISSTSAFARRGLIDWRAGAPMALAAGLAGLVGAASVSRIPREALNFAVPIVLIAIALYFAFARKLGDADARARLSLGAFTVAFLPVIGFYDGVFGPGAGSFYMIGFITLLGWGVVRATAHTKLANCASNLGALAFFIPSGGVVWTVGLTMAAGAFLGAQIGSRLAMKHGAKLIRPLLVVISCAMAARLLSDPANPLRVAVGAAFAG